MSLFRSSRRTMAVAGISTAIVALSTSAGPLHSRRHSSERTGAADDSLLVQRERSQWEALERVDTLAYASTIGPELVDVDVSGVRRPTRATAAQYVLGCRTTNFAMADARVVSSRATAVVTSKVTVDQTCWGQRAPSPLYVMTVYARTSHGWQPIAHSETPAAPR